MGYRGNDEGERWFMRCARCDAMVIAEPAGSGHTNANIVCDLCGMKMPNLPVVDDDYFNVVMRVGRHLGRVARFRRAR